MPRRFIEVDLPIRAVRNSSLLTVSGECWFKWLKKSS